MAERQDLGFQKTSSRNPSTPAGIGNLVADAAIDSRKQDFPNSLNGFTQIPSPTFPTLYSPVNTPGLDSPAGPGEPGFDPNRWQPLRVPTGARTNEQGEPAVAEAAAACMTGG